MPSISPPDINSILPEELINLIFRRLNPHDLRQAVTVCKRWREVGEVTGLWRWACPRLTKKNLHLAKELLASRRLQGISSMRVMSVSEEVVDGVASHPSLKSACISCSLLSPNERRLLAQLVTRVEEVTLSLAKEEASFVLGLALATPSGSVLRVLDLSWSNLGAVKEGVLAVAMSSLEEVHLRQTGLSTKQVEEVLSSVSDGRVKRLGLGGNNLSAVEVMHLAMLSRLEEVGLEATSLTNQQLTVLLSCLGSNSQLRRLHLSQNCLTAVEPALMARLSCLEEARLADSDLVPQQLDALLRATSTDRRLRLLDIASNKISTVEVTVVAQAVAELEEMKAAGCSFSQHQMEALFFSITQGCSLAKLDLSHTSLTLVAPEVLATVATLLVELLIEQTFLTSCQAEQLFDAISRAGSRLRELCISCNRISSVEPEVLARAVARLKVARLANCALIGPQVNAVLASATTSASLVRLQIGQHKFMDRQLLQRARMVVWDLD